jgi:hypothetical protein
MATSFQDWLPRWLVYVGRKVACIDLEYAPPCNRSNLEVNEMIDLARSRDLLSLLLPRRPKEHPRSSAAFRPLLEALARLSHQLGTALDDGHLPLIAEAHERWVTVVQELAWRPRAISQRPSASTSWASFRPLLGALTRTSYQYGTALDSNNHRWIDGAHGRWVAVMQELAWRVLDEEAA